MELNCKVKFPANWLDIYFFDGQSNLTHESIVRNRLRDVNFDNAYHQSRLRAKSAAYLLRMQLT